MPAEIFTPEFIAAQLKVCEAATKPPWLLEKTPPNDEGWATCSIIAGVAPGQAVYAQPDGGIAPEANRRFIAVARANYPLALAEIERLQAEIAAKDFVIETLNRKIEPQVESHTQT